MSNRSAWLVWLLAVGGIILLVLHMMNRIPGASGQ